MRQSLVFTAPYQIDIIEEPIPKIGPDQVLVQSQVSAISAGTEMLFYRGLAPAEGGLDSTIAALDSEVSYPLRYGYAVVGSITEVGTDISDEWLGRLVFAFHPHTSHFVINLADCKPVPAGIDPALAVLLPNMETAVNLVMDGEPLIGERVAIFGQGIVGLLTAHLLSQHPLKELITVEHYPLRREMSERLGVTQTVDPDVDPDEDKSLLDFDLTYELSGHPATLNSAIAATGFAGRVIIGSWYGQKEAAIDLGGYFHRSRVKLISSQVSTLTPSRHARWDKERRLETAWSMLAAQPDLLALVTHQLPIQQAADAYQMLDEKPETSVQVLLTY